MPSRKQLRSTDTQSSKLKKQSITESSDFSIKEFMFQVSLGNSSTFENIIISLEEIWHKDEDHLEEKGSALESLSDSLFRYLLYTTLYHIRKVNVKVEEGNFPNPTL